MSRKTRVVPGAVRNTRSRAALLNAATDLLASGDSDFSITTITKAADVSPQTLYNHFATKEALLIEAAAAALVEFEKYMFERVKSIESPLEQFAANLRLFGRASDTHPHYAAIIANSPISILGGAKGYSPGVAKHVAKLTKAGFIKPADVEIALISTASLLEQVVVLRMKNRNISESRVDDFVCQCLQLFGLTPNKARKLVNQPLPVWPFKT